MYNTNDAFTGVHGLFKKEVRYPITERQKSLIENTAEWIISQVRPRLNYIQYSAKLLEFKKSIIDFLTERFEALNCANIRTIGSNAKLFKLATKAGIPNNVLPQNVSIIITNKMCYYFKGSLPHRHIIKSY